MDRKFWIVAIGIILVSLLAISVTVTIRNTGTKTAPESTTTEEDQTAAGSGIHISIWQGTDQQLLKGGVNNGDVIEIMPDEFVISVDDIEQTDGIYFNAEKKVYSASYPTDGKLDDKTTHDEYFEQVSQPSDYIKSVNFIERPHGRVSEYAVATAIKSGNYVQDVTPVFIRSESGEIELNKGYDFKVTVNKAPKEFAVFHVANEYCAIKLGKGDKFSCKFKISKIDGMNLTDTAKETTVSIVAFKDPTRTGDYELTSADILQFSIKVLPEEEPPCSSPAQCLARIDKKVAEALR